MILNAAWVFYIFGFRAYNLHVKTCGGECLKRTEAAKQFGVPMDVLREYEKRGFCSGEYGDEDIAKLGQLLTLLDVGFTKDEAAEYLLLASEGCRTERLRMLERRRAEVLDDIHERENALSRIDYLRHELCKSL